jgi:O-methyltransferase
MIRNLTRRLLRRIGQTVFADVYSRLETLEYRSFNRRFYAIEQCAEYLVGAQIEGDYLEFGVYKGDTFSHAYKWISPHFKEMKFFAFDSFEGLPKPQGIDIADGYSSHFDEAQFACSQEEFMNNICSKGVDLSRVKIVKGWFDKTLSNEKAIECRVNKIAVAWIDCDLYESTIPVLKFITAHLSVGSVIIFDDWRCYRNHPDFGEQRACKEWLVSNPKIILAELYSFGWNGIAFTVVSC